MLDAKHKGGRNPLKPWMAGPGGGGGVEVPELVPREDGTGEQNGMRGCRKGIGP